MKPKHTQKKTKHAKNLKQKTKIETSRKNVPFEPHALVTCHQQTGVHARVFAHERKPARLVTIH